jgi:transposase
MGTPGRKKINRYGVAFKLRAVQMSNQSGVLIKEVAHRSMVGSERSSPVCPISSERK